MIQVGTDDFEKEVIKDEGTVLVEFTAVWCSVCKRTEKIFSAVEKEQPDVKFCFVDIEKDKELAEKFSIKGVPTTFVFKNGGLSARRTGALTKGDLYEMLSTKSATM